MTAVTAEMVKELRERTGVGMMECKKALVAANGDLEKAIEDLRKAGQAKAVKKGDRIAAEGLIVISSGTNASAIVEVNCETDFVAREEQFKLFANNIAKIVLQDKPQDLTTIMQAKLPGSTKSVEDQRLELVATLGEKIAIRRFELITTAANAGVVGSYLHGNADGARIAAIVAINTADQMLARDLAMQVAAMKPEYISEADIPADRMAKEREIYLAEVQEKQAGKPAAILEKIVAGKLKKFAEEITLLGQTFVKDPDQTIAKLLAASGTTITTMLRYEVGEGIEKKSNNFLEEVMSQVRES